MARVIGGMGMSDMSRKFERGEKIMDPVSHFISRVSLARCLSGEECQLVGMLKIASLKLKSLRGRRNSVLVPESSESQRCIGVVRTLE